PPLSTYTTLFRSLRVLALPPHGHLGRLPFRHRSAPGDHPHPAANGIGPRGAREHGIRLVRRHGALRALGSAVSGAAPARGGVGRLCVVDRDPAGGICDQGAGAAGAEVLLANSHPKAIGRDHIAWTGRSITTGTRRDIEARK